METKRNEDHSDKETVGIGHIHRGEACSDLHASIRIDKRSNHSGRPGEADVALERGPSVFHLKFGRRPDLIRPPQMARPRLVPIRFAPTIVLQAAEI